MKSSGSDQEIAFHLVKVYVTCLRAHVISSYDKLQVVCVNESLQITVEKSEFQHDHTSLEDDPREDWPKTSTTPKPSEKVHNIVGISE